MQHFLKVVLLIRFGIVIKFDPFYFVRAWEHTTSFLRGPRVYRLLIGDFQKSQSPHWLGFFLNGAELSLNSANSENLINHQGMNQDQFNCLLCQLCLWHCGRDPVSHIGDSGFEPSNLFKIILFLSLNSANSVKTFRKNSIRSWVLLFL